MHDCRVDTLHKLDVHYNYILINDLHSVVERVSELG